MRNSPFKVFRRNQRLLMVLLTGMAMFAFILLDQLISADTESLFPLAGALILGGAFWIIGTQAGRPGRYAALGAVLGVLVGLWLPRLTAPPPAVATTAGDLTEQDLTRMLQRRRIANQFVQEVYMVAHPPPMANPQHAPQIQQLLYQFWVQRLNRELFDVGGQNIREDVVLAFLLRQEAAELGISVGEDAVVSYIRRLGGDALTAERYREIVKRLGVGESELLDILREELTARLARDLLLPRAIRTPDEYWQDYKKLNVRQQMEVAAVPVQPFAEQLSEPAEAELMAFFEEYKELPPTATSPGFFQPRKARLAYLEIDAESLLEQAPQITDEQIVAYYEEHKDDMFRQDVLPETSEQPSFPSSPEDGRKKPKLGGEPPPPPLPEDPPSTGSDARSESDSAPKKSSAESRNAGTPKATDQSKPEAPSAPPDRPREGQERDQQTEPSPPRRPAGDSESRSKASNPSGEAAARPTTAGAGTRTAAIRAPIRAATSVGSVHATGAPAGERPDSSDASSSSEDNGKQTPPAASSAIERQPAQPADSKTQKPDGPEQKPVAQKKPEAVERQPKAGEAEPAAKANAAAKSPSAAKSEPAAAVSGTKNAPTANAKDKRAASPATGKTARDTGSTDDGRPRSQQPAETSAAGQPTGPSSETEPKSESEPAEVKYRPLDDELKAEIRDILRQRWVEEEIKRRAALALQFMQDLGPRHVLASPDAPDYLSLEQLRAELEKFAEEHGLHYEETPLLSYEQLLESEDYPIGRAIEPVENPFEAITAAKVADQVLGSNSEAVFQPMEAMDPPPLRNRYVYWVVEYREPHVPTFDEPGVREEVERQWRLFNARPAAERRARELAEKVREAIKAGKTMAEGLEGEKLTEAESAPPVSVFETPEFTWLRPYQPSVPRLNPFENNEPPVEVSSIPGIEGTDDAFMEKVFGLAVGDVATVPNADRSVFYVVHVVRRSHQAEEELQQLLQDFLNADVFDSRIHRYLAGQSQARLLRRWIAALQEKYAVRWYRSE
ncbi:MAG: hypothetical protein D6725_03970, partial [Planctomycetota bacterium]